MDEGMPDRSQRFPPSHVLFFIMNMFVRALALLSYPLPLTDYYIIYDVGM